MIQRKYAAWLSALPDVVMAALFLLVWSDPMRLGAPWVKYLMLVMLVEFVLVHATAFLGHVTLSGGSMWKRTLGVLGFSAFYMIFIGAFVAAFKAMWPVYAFLGLMASHLGVVWLGAANTEEAKARAGLSWGISAGCYLVAVLGTTFIPMPSLGVTAEVVAAADLSGKGLWVEQPWRVLAAGVFCFGAKAWFKSQSWKWTPTLSGKGVVKLKR